MIGLLGFIGEIFKPAAALIDSMHTSDEEKIKAKGALLEIQSKASESVHAYETKLLEAQATIINAEANSQSWLARNWRPMTMVSFVLAVLGYWFGLTPDALPPASVESMFDLVKIGLGGYVVGRSGEKIATSVAQVMKSR